MKKRRLFLLSAVGAAAIMAACTADEMLSEGGKATRIVASAEPTPIMVEALVDNGEWEDVPVDGDELHPATTRAVQTLNEGSLSATVQSMALYAYGQSGNASGYTRYVLDTYNSSTNQFSATTMPVFPAGGTSVNVYGWYPAMDSTPKTFEVQSDQSSDENFIKSDLMLANRVSCTRSKTSNVYSVTPAPLTFTHALSKINMNITPGDGVTITSVVINGVNRTATISDASPASLSVSCAGNGNDNVTVWTGTHTSGQLQVSAVVPPQTLKNTFVTITANTSTKTGKTAVYSLGPTGKAFATGKKYVMNLTVNQQDITPRAHDISDWDITAGTVEIEGNTTGGGGNIVLSEYEKTFTFGDANGTVTITGTGSYNVSSSNSTVAEASVSGTTITIDPDHAGDATIFVSQENSAEYGIINVTVNKATTAVTTAPTKASTLTYNGSAQNLITSAGVASNGTMQYSTDNSSFGTTIPTGTNAGSYSLYYRAYQENSTDYTGTTSSVSLGSVSIGQLPFQTSNSSNNGYLTIASIGEQVYTGSAITPTPAVTVKLSSGNQTLTSGTDFDYSYSNNTDVGTNTASVTVTGKGNYSGTANANFSIAQRIPLSSVTSDYIGWKVCSDGYCYPPAASLSKGVSAVAVLGYVSSTGHGYAIALQNATSQTWNTIVGWGSKNTNCAVPAGSLGSVRTAPSGTTWYVLTQANYKLVFQAMGSSDTYNSTSNGLITAAGGTALSDDYWSTSEVNNGYGTKGYNFYSTGWSNDGYSYKNSTNNVRPCLAF